MELSVIVIGLNEEFYASALLSELDAVLSGLDIEYELLLVDFTSEYEMSAQSRASDVRYLCMKGAGYGTALCEGFRNSHGDYVLTLSVDSLGNLSFIQKLWGGRDKADMIVVSRPVAGALSLENGRHVFERSVLNKISSVVLDVPLVDFQSPVRLYHRRALMLELYREKGAVILQEIVVQAYARGFCVSEISMSELEINPDVFEMHLPAPLAYVRSLCHLWRLRTSVESADYDHRAYDSPIPLQRYWQRRRYSIVKRYLEPSGRILDIGCGSSRIIESLPDAMALDFAMHKLRFIRKSNRLRARASAFYLPFRDRAFDQVILSQVIEHIPYDVRIFSEVGRVLAPGGIFIVGTPDYGRIWWHIIEFFYALLLPGAYADEHITHFSKDMLIRNLEEHGFEVLCWSYICKGDLILKARKEDRE